MTRSTRRRVPVGALALLLALVGASLVLLIVGVQLTAEWLAERDGQGIATTDPGPGDGIPDGAPARPAGVSADARAARVVHVVDGDTVHVVPLDGPVDVPSPERERIRLLNIDTPELRHPERGRECGAGTATQTLEDLLAPPAVVWLAADVEERDRFDRSLRYVWNEGGVDVQRTLVDAGLAEVIVVGRNDRFAAALFDGEAAARDDARGIWGPGCLD